MRVAELLALTYEEDNPPGGYITLYFAGGGAVRLEVECIEAELHDLWRFLADGGEAHAQDRGRRN